MNDLFSNQEPQPGKEPQLNQGSQPNQALQPEQKPQPGISDMPARQQALRADQSFIVQAPAGSGKTGLLVYRILTLLTSVERPEQVLAITFTRKATSEMRERLMHLLKQADQKQTSADKFEQQGIDLAMAVLQRDKEKNWRLLDTPQQLQLQTIDGFCAKLTGHMPWLSRLGDKARTTDQPQAHYAAAVEQLFNELLTDDESSILSNALQTVLFELDFDYSKTRKLFSSMLAKRDQWLRHLLQNDFTNLRSTLERTWRDIATEHTDHLNTLMSRPMQQQLIARVLRASELMDQDESSKATPLQSLKVSAEQDSIGTDLSLWRAVKFILLTNANAVRKTVTKNCGFPATDKPHKEAMLALLEHIADDQDLRTALAELDLLPDADFSDQDWQQLCALEQVLKALAGLLQLRFRAAGECDHSEVTQRANLALQDLSSPTELALRMDYQLQHILVDEFQDTSHSQISLLRKLTQGWGEDEGPKQTLFLVGDPMQSIYRFREADVSLFLRVANESKGLFPNLDIQPLTLTENFRSNAQLVTWFNNTFQDCFPKTNKVMSGAIRYAQATSSKQVHNDSSPVQCISVFDKKQEAERVVLAVQQTQKQIKELAQESGKAPGNIAILVRSRGHLVHLLPALRAAGIEYLGVDIQPLKETQAVIDVLALCKAICRLDDRVSWLALLRGPWCGLSLVEIQTLLGQNTLPIWTQLKTVDASNIDEASQARLSRFVSIMNVVQSQRQQTSLHGITRWAWQQFGGEQTLFDASLADIDGLFGLIAELEQGGDIASLAELDQALNGLYAKPEQTASNAVIVSTMHKSKGLQYDTVILPRLANKSKSDEKSVMMWAEHIDQQGSPQLLLAPIRMQEGEGTHYDYLRELEKQRGRNESIRLMYVACTRAERQLILIGQLKVGDKAKGEEHKVSKPVSTSLLATVWPALEDTFSAEIIKQEQAEEDEENRELPQTLSRLPHDFSLSQAEPIQWQSQQQLNAQAEKPQSPESALEYDWASGVAKSVGVVLHDWLQYHSHNLFNINVDQALKNRWRAELLAMQVEPKQINRCLSRLEKSVIAMQSDDNAQFIFKDHAEQQNEYALSCLEGGVVKTYRIDRTFVDEDNVRWIVDYKTTVTDDDNVAAFIDEQIASRHRKQLNKYGQLLSQIDERAIKLCVYFPLLKQWRVWDYC